MERMHVTILGCGSSDGVPQIGCKCTVCNSTNPKNNRTRASILLEIDKFKILIDAGPDIRLQALREQIITIDAVLITHAHFDHIGGIGDLRAIMFNRGIKAIPMFADNATNKLVKNTFGYAFPGILESNAFFGEFSLLSPNITVIPFKQKHGKFFSYGFRIGDFAYSTDVNELDENAYRALEGVKVWIIDCLEYHTSPTHFCLDDTIREIYKINPAEAIITHMGHNIDYELLSSILPSNIRLAYDGMKINL